MFWADRARPIIGLSPMADFTDLPFCRLVRECETLYGTPNPQQRIVLFREMASAEALIRGNKKTDKICDLHPMEHPVVQQLFGSKPEVMAEAAKIVVKKFAPDAIDINMGCPVYKAVSQFNGASLMRDPERAAEIVRAVKKAVSVPVSVKTRLGWSNPEEIQTFAPAMEAAGADLISIHARTKEQGYAGTADWKKTRMVCKKANIPILINGDIMDPESAQNALTESGAEGFLIARGALGRPWIFARIQKTLETGVDPGDPPINKRLELMCKHASYHTETYGERGMIKLRKHLPWYIKGIPNFRELRKQLVQVRQIKDVLDIAKQAQQD